MSKVPHVCGTLAKRADDRDNDSEGRLPLVNLLFLMRSHRQRQVKRPGCSGSTERSERCLVGPLGSAPRFAMDQHLAPARLFRTQNQAFLAVQAIDNVAPDRPAFPLQHHMDPSIAMADPRRHDLMHPLTNRSTRIPCTRLALRRTMLPRQPTGSAPCPSSPYSSPRFSCL